MTKKMSSMDFYKKAESYIDKQDYDEAIKILEEAVKAIPSSGFNWRNLAEVYFKMNEYDESVRCYKKALKLEKSKVRKGVLLYEIARNTREKGDTREAIELLKKSLELYDSYGDAMILACWYYYELEDYKNACTYGKMGVKRKPDSLWARANYAISLVAAQDIKAAREEYRAAKNLIENEGQLRHFLLDDLEVYLEKHREVNEVRDIYEELKKGFQADTRKYQDILNGLNEDDREFVKELAEALHIKDVDCIKKIMTPYRIYEFETWIKSGSFATLNFHQFFFDALDTIPGLAKLKNVEVLIIPHPQFKNLDFSGNSNLAYLVIGSPGMNELTVDISQFSGLTTVKYTGYSTYGSKKYWTHFICTKDQKTKLFPGKRKAFRIVD